MSQKLFNGHELSVTFDQVPQKIKDFFKCHQDLINRIDWLLINRDLNGRVRLIAPENTAKNEGLQDDIEGLARGLGDILGAHAHPGELAVLYEAECETARDGATVFPLDDFPKIWIVDRLATEGDWASIADESSGAPRIVFFSIKGGVGRSTALAASAWSLAQAGKRVLVLDLDLESPGLSTALLPPDRQPMYGITDWLVEDLVDNTRVVLESMVATSTLSYDGEIHVVPAHGSDPGEYISKLGRVWMPKLNPDGSRENWSKRLQRLINDLEARVKPDVILIDSRAGIDEVASSCVTDLGASLVLLFALDGSQTWSGYRILFNHWLRMGVAEEIRGRLKIVAAMVPEIDRIEYLDGLRDAAYDLFADALYDEVPAGKLLSSAWNFDAADDSAPHAPWQVKWHRSFAALRSLHGRLEGIDAQDVEAVFGDLIAGIKAELGVPS